MIRMIAATCLLLALPGGATAQSKWNPLNLLKSTQRLMSNECGWMIGHPFQLEGVTTQLALQVFSGDASSPSFLAQFDHSDARLIGRLGEPGMIITLRGGTFSSGRLGGLPVYGANSRARKGWKIKGQIRRGAFCGAGVALNGGPSHLEFFGEQSFLVAGAALAREPEVFAAYFEGRGDELRRLLERSREVEAAAAAALGEPSLADAADEIGKLGADLAAAVDRANELERQLREVVNQ